MNWFEPRMIYCERLDSSFWSEPFNALTNLFFIFLGIFSLYRLQRLNPKTNESSQASRLSYLMILTGIGSFSFHTFANKLTELLDLLGIVFFVLYFFFLSLGKFTKLSRIQNILILAFTLALTVWLKKNFTSNFVNGSYIYFPALFLFAGLVVQVKRKSSKHFPYYVAGLLLIFSAICFRSLDFILCEKVPTGVHFLWHTLNAFAFYILVRGWSFNLERPSVN